MNTANSDNLITLRQNSLDRKFCTKHDTISRIVCKSLSSIVLASSLFLSINEAKAHVTETSHTHQQHKGQTTNYKPLYSAIGSLMMAGALASIYFGLQSKRDLLE